MISSPFYQNIVNRVNKRWALLLIGIVLIAPLFFVPLKAIPPYATVRDVSNFGHVLVFFLLLLAWQCIRPQTTWRQVVIALLAVLIASVAIEYVQSLTGRNASVGDIVKNMIGAASGILVSSAWKGRAALLKMLLIVGILMAGGEVVRGVWIDLTLHQQFPVLNQFESIAEKDRLIHDEHAVFQFTQLDGNPVLSVEFQGGRFTGIAIPGFYGDWSHYNTLSFDILNPSDAPIALFLKITDAQHDRGVAAYSERFNKRLAVMPGWNTYHIPIEEIRQGPANRPLDMSRIRYVEWFGMNKPQVSFYLRKAHLR